MIRIRRQINLLKMKKINLLMREDKRRRISLLSRRILVLTVQSMGSISHFRENLQAQESQLCLQKKTVDTRIAVVSLEKNSRHKNHHCTFRENTRVVLRSKRENLQVHSIEGSLYGRVIFFLNFLESLVNYLSINSYLFQSTFMRGLFQ